MSEKYKKVLIIGITGGLAQITAKLLSSKYPNLSIVGIDNRDVDNISPIQNVEYKQIRYTRNEFERLFRSGKFDAVYHLARMSHAQSNPRATLAQRLDLNVMGTNRILELATQFGVKKLLVLSTWHVYGAYPDNPVFIGENSLLKASIKYPDLRDVVEMDQLSTNWMWKYQHEIETIVFRPCSIVGPKINNSMTTYLTTPLAPLAIDFNPMMQFIHEFDMANVLCHSLNNISTGVYNVATDETISLHEAKKILGVTTIPISVFFLERVAKFINKTLWSVPEYLIDYLKYPCLISNDEIKNYLPKDFFRFSIRDSLELIRLP